MPVFRDAAGDLRLVLLVRTDNGGVHGGQLGLPGGKSEPHDDDLLATALREAEEEIGLSAEQVEVLGELDPVLSGPSRFRVHPFLARVPAGITITPDPSEVADHRWVTPDEFRALIAAGEVPVSPWAALQMERLAGDDSWAAAAASVAPSGTTTPTS